MKVNNTQQIYDVFAAAAYISRTPKAVRRLIEKARIKPTKTQDARVQILKEELDRFMGKSA